VVFLQRFAIMRRMLCFDVSIAAPELALAVEWF